MAGVKVEGDEAVARALNSVAGDLQRPQALLLDAARIVRRDAQRVAPKRTGALAASIRIAQAVDGVTVRTAMPYAQYVAYGSIHNPHPVPFLEIAGARNGPQITRAVESRVDDAIREAGLA